MNDFQVILNGIRLCEEYVFMGDFNACVGSHSTNGDEWCDGV